MLIKLHINLSSLDSKVNTIFKSLASKLFTPNQCITFVPNFKITDRELICSEYILYLHFNFNNSDDRCPGIPITDGALNALVKN